MNARSRLAQSDQVAGLRPGCGLLRSRSIGELVGSFRRSAFVVALISAIRMLGGHVRRARRCVDQGKALQRRLPGLACKSRRPGRNLPGRAGRRGSVGFPLEGQLGRLGPGFVVSGTPGAIPLSLRFWKAGQGMCHPHDDHAVSLPEASPFVSSRKSCGWYWSGAVCRSVTRRARCVFF